MQLDNSAAIVPRVSGLMPVYNGSRFVERALASLEGQSLTDWELIAVDDGSDDDTAAIITPWLRDQRISLTRLPVNVGLGAALNIALERARAPLVAYLPCDDVIYREHLASLAALLDRTPDAVLAVSGVRHHYNRSSSGPIAGFPLQLVQVMHRRRPERWLERSELTTDDLHRMYWSRLVPHGRVVESEQVTCEWVDHPDQRHKILQEPEGGINPYRVRYNVSSPLRFHSTVGNAIDEVEHYRRFRERPPTPRAKDGLTILLVGELAYNADRVLALEERGHRLYGLWTPEPYWYNTVGPLPFGHVEDLPRAGWQDAIRRLPARDRPDIIYALLNWQAVPFAHAVLRQNPGSPFVWHFKEGPFICLEKGTWPQLLDLYTGSDGQIYCSPEMQEWFTTVVPALGERKSLVLDGDLPHSVWFDSRFAPRLSARDGEPHTVVPGRPIGLTPERVAELAAEGVHLHFYGDFTHGQWKAWIERALPLAPRHLHLHANADQERWVEEFSRYDAGWLHFFASENRGEIRRATWDDLNYPARMATLAAAGLPMLQRDNSGAAVATDSLARRLEIGLHGSTMSELAAGLRDDERMSRIRASVLRHRELFTFDHHADRLIEFFREVIAAGRRSTV